MKMMITIIIIIAVCRRSIAINFGESTYPLYRRGHTELDAHTHAHPFIESYAYINQK